MKKIISISYILLAAVFFITSSTFGQSFSDLSPTISNNPTFYNSTSLGSNNAIAPSSSQFWTAIADEEQDSESESTSSLTVGYIADTYNLQTDDGSYKYRYKGQLSGLMISSNSSSFMLSYGTADAEENEGDIRSIEADLQVGGNISIFDKFFGLPVGTYIPVRVNLGYRNLNLMSDEVDESSNSANIGSGGLGGGLGAKVRIPTGLPWLEDNLTGFVSLVKSVGGMGDLTGSTDQQSFGSGSEDASISGIRLTRSTDFNVEGKFERFLGSDIGVTVGFTYRNMSWMDEAAESFSQVFDVASGEQEGVALRATQSLIRFGINW